nr:hypothetical protein [Tanacetum cinerariifolium]
MVLEKDFASFALQEMEIHPLMILIRTLSMILQTFSPTLYNPNTRQTRMSYVETLLTMVMIVHHGSRLSMSRNRVTIKTLVIIIIHKSHRVFHNNIFVVITAANISTHTPEPSWRFKSFYDDDDDDDYEESTNPLPPSILITTSPLVLPIEDLKDSLIMGDEDLNTIPEKETGEVIKSSVEDLIIILSEAEDTSGNDSECDLPSCDAFSPIDNTLFEFDDEYISSDINPIFNEVLENIENKDSYYSNLDALDLLVTPLFDANEDECFDPGGDIDEIDIPLDFKDGYYDTEGHVLYLESLLSDNST